MSEVELKAFFDCSKELREAAYVMTAKEVEEHRTDILISAVINEVEEDRKIELEIDSEGIAHIPIQGMLTNDVSPSAAFFGESITTFDFITQSIEAAESNPNVQEIVFEISSGGGDVAGLEVAADAIFNAKKHTTGRIHEMAASAAFWLASQTDKIVAVGRTSSAGSIGVAAEFIDRSAQDKTNGVKRVILTSTDAPQKRLDITTAAGQKQTINRLDEIHTVFVDHIVRGISSRHPEINTEFVNKNFGKGSVMAADAALKVGMIDEIESLQASEHRKKKSSMKAFDNPIQTSIQDTPTTQDTEDTMIKMLSDFLASSPEAQTDFDTLIAEAKTEAIKAEREETESLYKLVSPIMKSKEYDEDFSNWGFEVLARTRSMQSFNDQVTMYDKFVQKAKSDDIQKDQPNPTPSDAGPTVTDMAHAEMKTGAQDTAKSIGV